MLRSYHTALGIVLYYYNIFMCTMIVVGVRVTSIDECCFQLFAHNQESMDEAKEMIDIFLKEEVRSLSWRGNTPVSLNWRYFKRGGKITCRVNEEVGPYACRLWKDAKCSINTLQIPVINIKVHIIAIISSPCQRQCDLLPSLGVRRSLTFLVTDSLISKTIFSSETA
jgi:hypothetical protein